MAKSIYDEYTEAIPAKLIAEAREEIENAKLKTKEAEKVLKRVKEAYESARIDPGEAIGIITAESFGEPGTQMSISKDEKLIVKIKKKIRILRISSFVDSLMNKRGSYKLHDTEILPLNDYDFYVPSINQDEKIEWKKVTECSRHVYKQKLLQLTTASGREITATANHSFVIRQANKIIPIMGSQLKMGDRIPVMNYLPEHCIKAIKLTNYLEHVEEQAGMLSRPGTRAKQIPNKINLNKEFGYFIGAYLSEGHANNGQVSISSMDDDFMLNIKSFITGLGLNYKEEINSRGFALSRDLKVSSSLLSQFIKSACNSGSRNKKIPDFAYSAKEEFVAGLLRGYFDGDGNFHANRKLIRVSTNSKKLRDGISLLLARFRIFSYKTKDRKSQYWLLIPYKYAPLFLQHIGSSINYKRACLEKLAELSKGFWNNKSQDYTDMISGFDDLFHKTAQKTGMPTRYVNNFTKRQKIGRTALFRYIKKFGLLAKEKNIDISEELNIMERMVNSDIIWDKITKMEYVDYNQGYVYDLSVPGLETFTTFEGIITHNTLNVFHLAGVSEVQVTQGLPRLIELFDARKQPSTPRIEVYLTKDNNKDPGSAKKIAGLVKETKLGEIVNEFSLNLSQFRIELTLNTKKMKELSITDAYLLTTLKNSLKNINIKEGKAQIILQPKTEQPEIQELYQLKEKCRELYVRGVKGISQVLPIKKDNEFIIICVGNNLEDVLKVDGVDPTRTICNDIFEVYRVLGIEAARQTIIKEASEVIKSQGLDIDIRHIMLLADVMTCSGGIKGITREGITGEKESVLAKASFETPIKHLISASLVGEKDTLNSVIENVMLNQEIPIGTGLPELITKVKSHEKK